MGQEEVRKETTPDIRAGGQAEARVSRLSKHPRQEGEYPRTFRKPPTASQFIQSCLIRWRARIRSRVLDLVVYNLMIFQLEGTAKALMTRIRAWAPDGGRHVRVTETQCRQVVSHSSLCYFDIQNGWSIAATK